MRRGGFVGARIAVLGVLLTTGLAHAQAAPDDAAVARARALRRSGSEAEAIADLRRTLAGAGRGPAAAKLTWELARVHVARRDFQAALAACRSLGGLAGGEAASHVCAAEAHLLWRRGTEARSELERVGARATEDPEVRYFAKVADGRVRELASQDDEAKAAYGEAIALAPARSDAYALRGALLRRRGESGQEDLARAAALDPGDPWVQLELGRALGAGTPASIAALERAVTLRPSFPEARAALADGYLAAGRLADARRAAEAAQKAAPESAPARVVLGRVALAEGRPDAAREAGEAAAKRMPNLAAARLLVADAWAQKGEIDLAVEAYQAAFGLDRSTPAALVGAARANVAAGRPTSARAFAERAVTDFPSHGPAFAVLGDALVADGDTAGARVAYQTAKKLGGVDGAEVDAKLAKLR